MASGYREPTLDELQALVEDHWRRHSGTYYRHLSRAGDLEAAARAKAEETQAEARTLIEGGMSPIEAWSQAQREIALVLI